MDMKLELVPIPVSDVGRAKSFYAEKVGFNVDLDVKGSGEMRQMRVVQLTPSGSACSISIGTGIVETPPGSVQALHLVVSDIKAARTELVERGVEGGGRRDPGARPGGLVRLLQRSGRKWLALATATLLAYALKCLEGRFPKPGYLLGPGLIHAFVSLCITTTCSLLPRRVAGLRRHSLASGRAFYARFCK